MSLEDIIKLIDVLPSYLCYIYPGYISMFLFYYFRALTLSDTKAKIIKSIVISYLYIITTRNIAIPVLNKLLCKDIGDGYDSFGFNVILIILSVITPYIIYMCFFKNNFMDEILKKIGIETTLDRNEIDMLQRKYRDGLWIYVYLKNRNIMYEGSLAETELENGCTKFFCLSKYRKYLIGENGKVQVLTDNSEDSKEKVLIYFDQISHFEIANVDNS